MSTQSILGSEWFSEFQDELSALVPYAMEKEHTRSLARQLSFAVVLVKQSQQGDMRSVVELRAFLRSMFQPHGSLSEFYVERADSESMVDENSRIEIIKSKLMHRNTGLALLAKALTDPKIQ
jgi:hypothetical protein